MGLFPGIFFLLLSFTNYIELEILLKYKIKNKMAVQLVSTWLPFTGEFPTVGHYDEHQNNDLPVLDDDDPLFYSNPASKFNLLDFVLLDNEENVNKIDFNCYAKDFLENLKKEGDENLFDISSDIGVWGDPGNDLLNQLEQSIDGYSSEEFSPYHCVEEPHLNDFTCFTNNDRNSSSPHSTISDCTSDSESNFSIESFNNRNSLIFQIQDINPTFTQIHDFSKNDLISEKGTPLCIKTSSGEKLKLPTNKKDRKKQQNRESAQRYREKKRNEFSTIDYELKELEERNHFLLTKVDETKSEIAYLKNFLSDIICSNV